MSQEKPVKAGDKPAIEIDYENIDVGRIMAAIKEKTSPKPAAEPEAAALSAADSAAPDLLGDSAELAEPAGRKSKSRRILLKIMKPFSPLIKLLVLPVYEEQRQMLLSLDNTNRRLDTLEKKIDTSTRLQEYVKLLHHLSHNIVVELSKLKIEEEMLKTKTRIIEKDFESLAKRERALEREKGD